MSEFLALFYFVYMNIYQLSCTARHNNAFMYLVDHYSNEYVLIATQKHIYALLCILISSFFIVVIMFNLYNYIYLALYQNWLRDNSFGTFKFVC